jgi:hypothetical protein
MAMLVLSHTILSVSARTGELSESPLLSKKTTQHLGDIPPNRVSPKYTNGCGELGVNHGDKLLIYRENLAMRSHEINPSIAREVIDKYNILVMAPFRSEGSRTPYIKMDQKDDLTWRCQ